MPGGDAEELQLAAYYVKEQPAGNATGMDWDNAMGVDALRNLLQTNGNSDISNANAVKLDGKKIYVAAGDSVNQDDLLISFVIDEAEGEADAE